MKFCIAAVLLGLVVLLGATDSHTNQDGPQLHGNNGFTVQVALLAGIIDASEYGILTSGGTLAEGILIPLVPKIAPAFSGDEIAPGIYHAPMGFQLITITCSIGGGEGSVIGFQELHTPDSSGVSVTCQSGYYACCYCQDGCPVARCRRNATPEVQGNCQGGGQGATQCSISKGDCP